MLLNSSMESASVKRECPRARASYPPSGDSWMSKIISLALVVMATLCFGRHLPLNRDRGRWDRAHVRECQNATIPGMAAERKRTPKRHERIMEVDEVALRLRVEGIEEGRFLAISPDLPGLVAEGRSITEAGRNRPRGLAAKLWNPALSMAIRCLLPSQKCAAISSCLSASADGSPLWLPVP